MSIKNIFDFSSKLYDEIDFDLMAKYIMNDIVMIISNNKYRINDHNDIFVHGDEYQKIPFIFYFHRQNGKSFKGGTFKGLYKL